MSKYQSFEDYLRALRTREWRTSFRKIERIIGNILPPSARAYPAWWSNNPSNNVMTNSWLSAGWQTENLDIPGEKVTFRKVHWQRKTPEIISNKTSLVQTKQHISKIDKEIVLHGVSESAIRILLRRAAANQRTLEAEIICLIHQATAGYGRLERAQAIRELVPQGIKVDLASIIREGRDTR